MIASSSSSTLTSHWHDCKDGDHPGPSSPLDSYEAAQSIFPSLARPLQKYLRITRYFSTSKVPQDYPWKYQVIVVPQKYYIDIQIFMIITVFQTATEAHHGQHLGPPGHLHHVRHGAQSLPREVPRFKPRSSGLFSIEMTIIDCSKLWS